MTLISSSIPNFVNGISQQPYTLRLSSQGELQENGLSTVSSGMRKRPPTEHLARISVTPITDALAHMIDRDGTEQYNVILTNGDLKVFRLDGTPVTVAFTNKAYLDTAIPADQSFALTTVADYTFIVNRTKATAASTTLTPTRPHETLINVRLGNYGKTYEVTINGTVAASYTTPNGADSGDVVALSTDGIAEALRTALVASGFNTTPWVLTRHGSTLYLKNLSTDFTISTADGFNSTALVAIKRRLQKFTDLPANPRIDGFMVEIVGDQASSFDNYWVRFDASGVNDSVGVWREAPAPGVSVGVNPLTMPHLLIREADGTFSFRPAEWEQRTAGDLTSNPNPSFLGRAINDIFFFQNRLGFLSDENFIESETGKYFNLFRTTVVSLLDSDPVDVNAATNKVAVLEHAVAFSKQLLLFSKQQQFLVDSAELMTPKKVPIKPTTDFPVNTRAKPVAAGRNVYFVSDKGSWSALREFGVDSTGLANDAADVSSHVPKYLPAGVIKIAAGPAEDILLMLSENDRGRLYVYKYYFSGDEKLQSSWSTFSFDVGGSILAVDFIKSVAYLTVSRSDGVYFEKIDFSLGASTAGEPYQVLLDRKKVIPKAALTFDGTVTRFNVASLGYPATGTGYMAVAHGGGTVKAAQLADITISGSLAAMPGDLTASDLTVGRKFMWRYTLSTLTIKTQAPGGGLKSDTDGRLQIRKVGFNHADTGFYVVKITPAGRPTYTYTFSGKILGTSSTELGNEVLVTGQHTAAVMTQNTAATITLESDLPLPVSILSADWEGYYVKRSRPV